MEKRYTTYSLHKIKDIGTLEELSKYDREIRKYATLLDVQLSEDIVQDFYLKMWEYFDKNPKKKINGGFIATTLRNRFIDTKRYNKKFDYGSSTKDAIETYLLETPAEKDYELTKEDTLLYQIDWVVENELTEDERELVYLTYDMNLSELARQTGINYSNLRYEFLKIKEKIKKLVYERF